ncbi:hypothetical protein ACRQ5Q_27630 [Bradyrhizobium sp. PMVTL-01]|uniref:hypothetical protein n=1 Tax=Bradyrhizobium sp. PMVTL-01 TaxID=3434999 RepID=UPI003F6FAAB9
MTDPIPAGFITLPEAVQRITGCVSEAHIESAIRILSNARGDEGATDGSENQGGGYPRLSREALFDWSRRDFAVAKLKVALQAGAISASVRCPESGQLFRLTPAGWAFEPFWEQIIRGGVIPFGPGREFECHGGRTVLLETVRFDDWLSADVKNWSALSKERLCCKWLAGEMLASPRDKRKSKNAWFAEAKEKYRVSRREFDRLWSQAITETNCNWGRPGAPKKSSHESPR